MWAVFGADIRVHEWDIVQDSWWVLGCTFNLEVHLLFMCVCVCVELGWVLMCGVGYKERKAVTVMCRAKRLALALSLDHSTIIHVQQTCPGEEKKFGGEQDSVG